MARPVSVLDLVLYFTAVPSASTMFLFSNSTWFCTVHQCCPPETSQERMFCLNRGISEMYEVSLPIYVVALHLRENRIPHLSPSSFVKSPYIRELDLSINEIDMIDGSSFVNVSNLLALDLSHNRLWELKETTFHGLYHLRKLNLGYNRLQFFFDVDLKPLRNLEELILEHNPLMHLSADNFFYVTRLRSLNLNNIGLKKMETHIFQHTPLITTLLLAGNSFSEVPTAALEHMVLLDTLDLTKNPISVLRSRCFRELHSLRTLFLKNLHSLSRVDAFAFGDVPSLRMLDLSYNPNLKTIDDAAFVHAFLGRITVLEELHLRQCDLSYLSQTLQPWDNVSLVDLSENSWHCDCQLKWITELRDKIVFDRRLRCKSPNHLRNRLISEMLPEEFLCKSPRWSALTISITCVSVLVATATVALMVAGYQRWIVSKQTKYIHVGTAEEEEQL